ncbi:MULTISPECIES: hypothetical protein [Streptomyces]|uniref:hypothetical protein n=1 Tax=Streptomyces TaxID=1883 RepID=UPI001409FE63|nr:MULTISPECIES: hypothetical protein [Streptomyces]MDH6229379.1 hypothetical protein [Streptomyces sp. MJP52]
MNRLAPKAATALAAAALLAGGLVTPAHAAPAWDRTVKCQQKDWDGRVVPTRAGNSQLGWKHFSGPHNIRKCRIVNAAINGKPDRKSGARLEYWAYAWNGNRRVQVIVIAQYARKTADGRYDAGPGQRIGVITAYCKGMNRCPNWLNQ